LVHVVICSIEQEIRSIVSQGSSADLNFQKIILTGKRNGRIE